MVLVQGWDLSLQHGGIVELEDGVLSRYWYISPVHSIKDRLGERCLFLDLPKKTKSNRDTWDSELFGLKRLHCWSELMSTHLLDTSPSYVGLEDYALGSKHMSHATGEHGCIPRLFAFNHGIMLRSIDPSSVKMFVAHSGSAEKEEVESAVKARWKVDFNHCNSDKSKSREVSEDLADAFAIAQIVWTEYQLRLGQLNIRDLHEMERRIFNRATKSRPENILSRGWLHNKNDALDG